jgi:cytochrome c-type biogenesis protein CcmH/NrfG
MKMLWCALLGCSLLASDVLAADSWVGTTVILKETAQPQVGNERRKWTSVPLPAVVKNVNGTWLWLGTAWVQQNEVVKVDDAPAYFTGLIEREPDSPVGYALRGLSWFAKREYENAIKDFSEAIRMQPSNTSFFAIRGKAYYMKNKYDEAMADFTEAIRLDPTNLVAYNDRGVAWNAKGDFQKAIEQFNEVLRVAPDNALAYANRGASWYDQEEYEKGLADLNKAITLDPELVAAYVNRGQLLTKMGDYPGAISDYDKAVKIYPTHWEGYCGWARILSTSPWTQLRDGRRAKEMALKACELSNWDEWRCVVALAASCAELGDFETAIKWQTKAMAMSQPAKDRDQRENEKRLKAYQAGKPFYMETKNADGIPPDESSK